MTCPRLFHIDVTCDMLLHLLGIFNANLLQHYLFLEDLQSFDRTCSKEPDQITVLCDVHQDEVFQCMYPQSSQSHSQQTASLLTTFCFRYRLFWKKSFIPPLSDLTSSMMTSSVVKKANIAGDDVCSLENLAYN